MKYLKNDKLNRKKKASHGFLRKTLTFELQQEVLKFINIYMSWNLLEADLGTNFLKLKVLRTSAFSQQELF